MSKLEQAVKTLINETEDMDDALAYADDVAIEVGCPATEVVEEIRRQYAVKGG